MTFTDFYIFNWKDNTWSDKVQVVAQGERRKSFSETWKRYFFKQEKETSLSPVLIRLQKNSQEVPEWKQKLEHESLIWNYIQQILYLCKVQSV